MDPKKKFGQTLKAEREKLSKSLKDIAQETSIKLAYLEAVEEGTLDTLIAATYARGFTKQYANFLGLNGEHLLREEKFSFLGADEKSHFAYGISAIEKRGADMPSGRLWTYVLWAVLGLTLFSAIWYAIKHFGWF